MKHIVAKLFILAISGGSAAVHAAPITVNGLGVAGWASGDTRNATGAPANAAQIAAQIKFMGQGQTVADAVGGTPDSSPSGSFNGAGYVRLDGTNANAGKSDIGFYNAAGIAAAGALLDGQFSASYRAYTDPNTTVRTVGFGISLSNDQANCGAGANSACYFTFSHIDPDTQANPNTWLVETIGASNGLFSLFGAGAPGGGGPAKTLSDWSADATWGFLLSGSDYNVVRMNFNLGSFQRNALVYVDWLDSSLLNGGDRIDFVSADHAAVPEPGTLALVGVALACLSGLSRRKSR